MNVLDLFSGIGGFSLGLERAGMRTVAFCEIDRYCQAVLRKHWPDVPIFDDVRTLNAETLANPSRYVRPKQATSRTERQRIGPRRQSVHEYCEQGSCCFNPNECDGNDCWLFRHPADVPVFGDVTKLSGTEIISVANAKRRERWADDKGQQTSERNGHSPSGIDVICGGFPCQDISVAGKGAGIEGSRSGLWSEYARIIGEVRPRYVIVENVAALLGRGIERVLGDLAALGFDAEWHCIPASAVGAPHRRDRVWIIAHSISAGRRPDAARHGLSAEPAELQSTNGQACSDHSAEVCGDVADAECGRRQSRGKGAGEWDGEFAIKGGKIRSGICERLARGLRHYESAQWLTEPAMGELVDGVSNKLVRFRGRIAKGVPNRVNKLRALGNAIVPQIAEIIGRAIMANHLS